MAKSKLQFGKLKADLGAREVVGVDISQAMIDIARNKEQQQPLGIIYEVTDVRMLKPPEVKFDVVTAFYLLNFARKAHELEEMVRVISEQLMDGQAFFGVVTNVCGNWMTYNNKKHRKYAFMREAVFDNGPLRDGDEVKYTHYNDKECTSFSYTTYFLSPTTYEETFKKVGFTHFKWVPMESNPNIHGREFYDDFVKYAPAIGMVASK